MKYIKLDQKWITHSLTHSLKTHVNTLKHIRISTIIVHKVYIKM
jgi:hypothetical protein